MEKVYLAFTAEISPSNQKRLREIIRDEGIWKNTQVSIEIIAEQINEKARGWINYYGLFSKQNLRRVLFKIDKRLVKWLMRKHKVSYRRAEDKLRVIRKEFPTLFCHWEKGYC